MIFQGKAICDNMGQVYANVLVVVCRLGLVSDLFLAFIALQPGRWRAYHQTNRTHRDAARKVMGVAAGLAAFGVGCVIIGKDRTRKSRADGLIVITYKAIYVAGNDYPFDRIISLTKQGPFQNL